MNCEQLITYLSDYIDNSLDDELTREAEAHLATCDNCKVVLNSTQKTILLYRAQGKNSLATHDKLFDMVSAAFLKKSENTGQ